VEAVVEAGVSAVSSVKKTQHPFDLDRLILRKEYCVFKPFSEPVGLQGLSEEGILNQDALVCIETVFVSSSEDLAVSMFLGCVEPMGLWC